MGIGVSARNGRRISTTWERACFDRLFTRRSPSQCWERHGLRSRLLRRRRRARDRTAEAVVVVQRRRAQVFRFGCAQRAANQGCLPAELEAAKTPDQEQAVRKAAADEMVQAIEGEGMTAQKSSWPRCAAAGFAVRRRSRRHGPEVDRPDADVDSPLRRPVTHAEDVADDARAGPQLPH